MDWNELQKAVRKINEHCVKIWGEKKVNQSGEPKKIRNNTRLFFDWLEENHPGWQNDPGWPREAITWWRRSRDLYGRGGWFPIWKDFAKEILLAKLKPNALKLYMACCCTAWTGDEPNDKGMHKYEFFRGNERLCLDSRISHSNSWTAFRELYDCGLLINVRKHPIYGTWIRRVVMGDEALRLLHLSREENDVSSEPRAYPDHRKVVHG